MRESAMLNKANFISDIHGLPNGWVQFANLAGNVNVLVHLLQDSSQHTYRAFDDVAQMQMYYNQLEDAVEIESTAHDFECSVFNCFKVC